LAPEVVHAASAIRPIAACEVGAVVDVLERAGYTDASRRETVAMVQRAPGGLVLVAERGGEVVAAALGLRFATSGWIGGVGVTPDARRQGIASRLTTAVSELLTSSGARTLFLHATPRGRLVYERLGFSEEADYAFLEHHGPRDRDATTLDAGGVRPLEDSDFDDVLALDRQATGEDRRSALGAAWPSGGLAHGGGGRLAGFHLRSQWGGAATVAIDPRAGRALLRAAECLDPPSSRIALPFANATARAIAHELGYTETRRTTRMRLGPAIGWRPETVFGVFNLYWG
jgi:predicted N-acetyltransferase YhbS